MCSYPGWAGACKIFQLSLVTDSAKANQRLASWLGTHIPSNGLLTWHGCNAHETNHAVEPIWRGCHVNEMFCAAKVLHSGNTFFDLITHVACEITSNMEVTFDTYDPQPPGCNLVCLQSQCFWGHFRHLRQKVFTLHVHHSSHTKNHRHFGSSLS